MGDIISVQEQIFSDFMTGNDAEKVAIIEVTQPAELGIESKFYQFLVEAKINSNAVWLAYLHRVGLEGFNALPDGVKEKHMLPLLLVDQTEKTVSIFLRAQFNVPLALMALEDRYKMPTFKLANLAAPVKGLKEEALPILKRLLNGQNHTQVAFSWLGAKQWQNQEALAELSLYVHQLLMRTTNDEDVLQCARVLAMIDPIRLIQYGIDELVNMERTSALKLETYLTNAYYKLDDEKLKQKFIVQLVKANLSLEHFSVWEVLKVLMLLHRDRFYEIFKETSNYTRGKFANELYEASQRGQTDMFVLLVDRIKDFVYKLLDEDFDVTLLIPFLISCRRIFAPADYVEFIFQVQRRKGDVSEMSYDAMYDKFSPEYIMEVMEGLDWKLKSDAALAILKKLNGDVTQLEAHRPAFVAAMDVVVWAYCLVEPPIRANSIQIVQLMPPDWWAVHLQTIMLRANPEIAIQFAIFILKQNPENEQAVKTFLRLFKMKDSKVLKHVEGYLAFKQPEETTPVT